jgi:hypothetical protein
MKADILLAERRRIEREQQAGIRAMLAPRPGAPDLPFDLRYHLGLR